MIFFLNTTSCFPRVLLAFKRRLCTVYNNILMTSCLMQPVRKHSVKVISALWASVDWSWPKNMGLVCASWSQHTQASKQAQVKKCFKSFLLNVPHWYNRQARRVGVKYVTNPLGVSCWCIPSWRLLFECWPTVWSEHAEVKVLSAGIP